MTTQQTETTGFGRYGVHYQESIASSLKIEPATARLVYGWMVSELGTLDHLNSAELNRQAALCLAEVEMDRTMAERVAQSVGL